MEVTYEMVVDFARPYKNHTLLVTQNDHLSRVCHFTLRANGRDLDVSDVASYTITAVRPDSSFTNDSGTLDVDDENNQLNEITYTVPQALTELIGTSTCIIKLISTSGAVLQSFEFYIRSRNLLKEEDDESEDDLAGFRDILARATEAIEKIETLSNKSRLPNPYPMRISVGDKTYTYDGSETVSVAFTVLAYLSTDKTEVTPITWF